jgi:hypothetical protein
MFNCEKGQGEREVVGGVSVISRNEEKISRRTRNETTMSLRSMYR